MRRRLDRVFRQMAREVGAPGLVAAMQAARRQCLVRRRGGALARRPRGDRRHPVRVGQHHQDVRGRAHPAGGDPEGELDLDQTIDAWLPDIPRRRPHHGADAARAPERPLRLLPAQGLPGAGLRAARSRVDRSRRSWRSAGPRVRLRARGFSYSNTNYVLLGLILEQVTGQPLATLIDDQLLAPLGMDETVFQQAGQPVGLVGAKGFWKAGQGFREWSDGTDFRPTTSARDRGLGRGRHGGERPRPARLGDGALRRPGADPRRARPDAGHVQGLGLRPGRPHPDGGRARMATVTADRCVGSCP